MRQRLPGTDYYRGVSHTPGPEAEDINTMHRYRDAIVCKEAPYERRIFGAYALFPYRSEEEYRNHCFFKSIEKVNIGGLSFLPSATAMVEEMLDQLIADTPDSAFDRATLPLGWQRRLGPPGVS